MEQPLALLACLVLVSLCRGDTQEPRPDFCRGPCPSFKLIQTHQDYEERLYAASNWITTKIGGKSIDALMAANSQLKGYCNRQTEDYSIPTDTWPALITARANEEYWMSWFVPPGVKLPENNDAVVSLQSKPEVKVYVRIFGGSPSLESGEENACVLLKALGRDCNKPPTYSGAGYDSPLSLYHHNELWIYADDIDGLEAK